MSNAGKKSKDRLLIALIIGALSTSFAAALLLSNGNEKKKPYGKSVGSRMIRMGQLLNAHPASRHPIIKDVEKKITQYEEAVSEILQLVASGLDLWGKIKKGI